ncbi:TfuA-like protein, partial [[Kitasatospora] papulosa]|uniref:TfuA-like protein n=1 Tax=[Kitasatospora] papulosa TaxID=1464011 RepID=UPI0036CC7384
MIHVFVGPTLPASEPMLAAPGLRVRPPARHGDLFDPAIGGGDTVVLIDGVYHQVPALRHKEILAAIGRGVTVIGAASIGALRAAELAPYGMLGIGGIYTAYAHGDIDGDDEVAVGQAPDGEFGALTWPLVNLRQALQLAQTAGVVDGARAAGLLAALSAVYYPQRAWAAVRAVCRRQGELEFAAWLTEQREWDRHFGDLKRADALAAVRAALDGAAAKDPAVVELPMWGTAYFRRWSNATVRERMDGLELSTEDRLIYQQIFDPAFRERWAAYLEHLSQRPADGGPGMALDKRLVRAGCGDLPADRVFHPVLDLRDEQTAALLLAGETAHDRQAVARYAAALAWARCSRPGFSTAAVRDDLTRRLLVVLSGTVRARTPEETWDAVAGCLEEFGITRVADLTGLDCIGLPVFTAIRPASRTLSTSQGKGATPLLAKLSAVMEAIELWHVEQPLPVAAYGPAAEVAPNCPVAALPLTAPYPEDALIQMAWEWATGTGLLSGAKVLLPVDLVRRRIQRPQWTPDVLRATSTGLACGNTRDEALLHALFEVVERDVLYRDGQAGRRRRTLIDPATVDDPHGREVIERLAAAGM